MHCLPSQQSTVFVPWYVSAWTTVTFWFTSNVCSLTPRLAPPRYRLAAILAASLPTRCVLLLNAFLLLPPHTCWTSDTWGTYVVNATSAAPEAHALAMGVYNVLDKVNERMIQKANFPYRHTVTVP